MKNWIIGLVVILVIGFAGYKVMTSDYVSDVLGGANNAPLVNTRWKLVELDGQKLQPASETSREAYITLQQDNNRLVGYSGCNRMTGSYVLVGKKLSFADTAMTRMACADGMDTEQKFGQALQATVGWHIKGATLSLRDKSGNKLATFEQTSAE